MMITEKLRQTRTRFALLWMQLSGEPLIALRSALFPFILYRDFGASPLQLGAFCAIRPVMSLFSFYWSSNLGNQSNKLLSNLMGAWVLARLPFVFIPFATSAWYLLLAEGLFWLFDRAGSPALMEILKLNLPKDTRHKTFSWSFALKWIESIFCGLLFASLLSHNAAAWRGLICLMALVSISSVFVQKRIYLPVRDEPQVDPKLTWQERIVGPWMKSFELLKNRPEFCHFQLGFMIAGFGLMMAVPAITIFTSDVLSATHANVTVARTICMAIGVVISTPFWHRAMSSVNVSKVLGFVAIGFVCYLFSMLMAEVAFGYYFVALLIYGVAQAGSHLLWNLSGPLFARDEDSSQFTMVSILTVGLRGLIAPQLGSLLCMGVGASNALIVGALVIGFGAWKMLGTRYTTEQI